VREAAVAGVPCLVFGPAAVLEPELVGMPPGSVDVVDSPEWISNSEEPGAAVRSKRDASIMRAAAAVAEGRAAALVTPGSTGAALAAGLLTVKRMRGVYRPALAVLLPVPGRPVLLLDVGATVEVRAEQLVQFAFMGAAFMHGVMGVEQPRVGLLNVGEEPEKGTAAAAEAHALLRELEAPPFEFAGNVEGDGLTAGEADVVVTDGFTGNIALKLMEGTTRTLVDAIRSAIRSGAISRIGGLLIRGRLGELRARLDPETVAGAYLLGLRGPVVVCHGSSTKRAIANAIALADRAVAEDVVGRTGAALEAAGVTRAASVPADTLGAR
jgi:glycerol-3-phosphate acyltransferase PlsX